MAETSHLISGLSDAYRLIREHAAAAGDPGKAQKIVVLRNFSTEYLEPFLRAYLLRAGLGAEVVTGGFDTVQQDILTPALLEGAGLVVLALDLEALAPDWRQAGSLLRAAADRVAGLAESLIERTDAPVMINSFVRPVHGSQGLNALADPDSADSLIVDANAALLQLARRHRGRLVLADWERLVMIAGAEASFDHRMRYIARSPYKAAFLSAYAYEIFKLANMRRGGVKKALILDCDNTLWGGIVGEVGPEGIQLDPHNFPGRAFYDFQRSVVRLAQSGVMVALCSKNNEEDVLAVLDGHPDCLLRRDHLVGWRINWRDKEQNIAELVRELNVGMDTVVFVDDSPTECARVGQLLPGITVRQVPAQIFDLSTLLEAEGLFDNIDATEEDRSRAGMYQAESRRREIAATFSSVEDFLASLQLAASIRRYGIGDSQALARVAQLTRKTNQFTLTTRRYSDAEVTSLAGDPNVLVLGMSVTDRFGDFGLTGVAIARVEERTAHIDSFLMSCRILGRDLERQLAATTLATLRDRWSVESVTADYIPTPKNGQVADFWDKLGFQVCDRHDRCVRYQASLDRLALSPVRHITLTAFP